MLCCDKCPRVFHLQCSGSQKPPDADDEWFCSICKVGLIHSSLHSELIDFNSLVISSKCLSKILYCKFCLSFYNSHQNDGPTEIKFI